MIIDRELKKIFAPRQLKQPADWIYENCTLRANLTDMPGSVRLFPYAVEPVNNLINPHIQRITLCWGSQTSKALDLDTEIPTPTGWTTIGKIKEGDIIFGADGKPCKVTETTDVFHGRKCYKVTFRNGESIVADEGHLWGVLASVRHRPMIKGVRAKERRIKKYQVKETKDLCCSNSKRPDRIQVSGSLQLQEADLPIDPYVLGAWLGDGTSNAGQITQADGDFSVISEIASRGYSIEYRTTRGGSTYYINRGSFGKDLRRAGVFKNKHIPEIYFRASEKQRMDLLKGLMDTDGSCDTKGRASFVSKKECLARGVFELAASLGLKSTIIKRKCFLYEKDCGFAYCVSFNPREKEIFTIKRKQERVKPVVRSTFCDYHEIISVEEVDSVPVRCIGVDNESHLFLAGRSLIPTHNTLSMMAGMGYLLTEFPKDAIWIMPSASNALNFSKGRWLPFIEDCNALRDQCPISASSGRIDSDKITNMRQEFLTCTLTFAGAGSENNVKSAPVAYLVMDEIDEIDEDIRAAANERVKGRREFKVIQTSTPTLEKKGVWSEYLKGDQRRYNVPCPHCKETFKFEWRQQDKKRYSVGFDEKAKLEDGSWDFDLIARTAHYRCPHCDGKILDAHKPDMLKSGEWIAENPHAPREHRSYHLNSLYSPVMTFANLMIKWLQAQGNNAELKKFIQGDLAEPWNDELVSHDGQSRSKELEADYERGDLKGEVRIIGADTQANDYRYIVRGFDRDGSNYLIDYGIAAGFAELDAKFEQHKCHKGIIDTGGNRTAEVYQEIYKRRSRWFGCKGFKTMAEPYRLKREDPFTGDQKGRAGRAKFLMLHVCKDVWEPEVVHLRSGKLKGFYTFTDTPKDYYDQLFGAYWVEQSDKHGRKVVTRKTKNCGDHYLDCEVYARALSKFLGIARVDIATPKPSKDDDQPKQPKRTRNRSASSFW